MIITKNIRDKEVKESIKRIENTISNEVRHLKKKKLKNRYDIQLKVQPRY